MAIKHVVVDGVGFAPVGYLLTSGIGDFSAGGGGGSPTPWLQNRTRRLVAALFRARRRR